MADKCVGLVDPCLGAPFVGLIFGAFGEVAVLEEVIRGGGVTGRYRDKNKNRE
jgi:hypothetical protein